MKFFPFKFWFQKLKGQNKNMDFEILENKNDFVIFKTTVWKLHPKRTLINDSSYTMVTFKKHFFGSENIFKKYWRKIIQCAKTALVPK